MESMTGFGRGRVAGRRITVTAEARSVNNRGLDIRVRTPAELSFLEGDVRSLVRGSVSRGSVQVTLLLESAAQRTVKLNRPAAAALHHELAALSRELKLSGTVSLDLLGRFPQVLFTPPEGPAENELRQAAVGAAERAVKAMQAARRIEGASLKRILAGHLKELERIVARIHKLAPKAIQGLCDVVAARVLELAGEVPIDRVRVVEEAALLAARRDFTEELQRLATHLKALRASFSASAAVGRNLEFLTQEILRELNTIASKAPGNDIPALSVQARVTLEKIREQVANVE